jgi:hypothetical protein
MEHYTIKLNQSKVEQLSKVIYRDFHISPLLRLLRGV